MSSIFGLSSGNRMTGMMSGLDTDSFVKKMTGATTSRIAKMQQQIQLLNWKAASYQNISSKMISFSNTYMSYSSKLNALSSSFYSSKSVTSSSDAIEVSGYSPTADKLSILNATYAQTANLLTTHGVHSSTLELSGLNLGLNETNNLLGEIITFSYGGEDYKVEITDGRKISTNADLVAVLQGALDNTVIDEVTNQKLGDVVTVGVNGSNQLTMTLNNPLDPNTLEVKQISVDAISLIGIATGHKSEGGTPMEGAIIDVTDPDMNTITDYMTDTYESIIEFDYNGTKIKVEMPAYNNAGDATAFRNAIQKAFNDTIGTGKVTVALDITTYGDSNATLSITANDKNSVLSLASVDPVLGNSKGSANWQAGMSNRLAMGQKLSETNFATALRDNGLGQYEMEINGKTLFFDKDITIQDMMDQINTSAANVKIEYLGTTNNFVLTSTLAGAAGGVAVANSGGNGSNMADVLFGTGVNSASNPDGYLVTAGEDAKITISYDGGTTSTVLTRSSNSFDLDGMTITLDPNSKHDFSTDGKITFKTKNDVGNVVENVTDMLNAFNEIIETIYKELGTKYDREYPPLTAEQKKDMTESEIALWEEKARAGLINNDPTVRALSTELRFIFAGLSDYGISISSKYEENGKLIIDEDALRKVLEENPDELIAKMTGTDGVMSKLKSVFDDYASTTSTSKGKLISIAGIEGGSILINDTQISKQIEDLEKSISAMERRLSKQQERYYRQFTALEVYIAKMSAQSGWLMDYDF